MRINRRSLPELPGQQQIIKIGAKESNNATIAIDVIKENKALKIDKLTVIKPQITKLQNITPPIKTLLLQMS
ncbi:MAG: hypothetical protein ACEY3F_07785, partial [Wolbachia sp.]